jgi:cyclopropane fatty-acyl-phospholipid synthase-like methyltransferase
MNKWIYELFYRTPFVPISWIFGSPHEMKEYTELLESGRIPPGYLSKIGFDVTGVDFSPTAIKRARANARAEGLEVTFFEDDLTNLHQVSGKFDLLVDFGALNDLQQVDRDLYMQNVLPLTHTGSCFILMCFAKSVPAIEIERRFAQHFSIETLNKRTESATARSIVAYCMTRN